METKQPANRITIEQATVIVDAINPGLPDDEEEEDDYDLEYQDWSE